MSTRPIWNPLARRNELGRARKITIYLSKMLIGAVVWALLVLPFDNNLRSIAWCSLAVFITSKVCYYVNNRILPDRWDDPADWCCDGVLHLWWVVWWQFEIGHPMNAWIMIALFLATYPWSAE